MKKFLISAFLLSQAVMVTDIIASRSPTSSLVPREVMESGNNSFHRAVSMAIREVQAGRSSTSDALVVVGGTYQEQLATVRTRVNQEFLNRIRDQEDAQYQQLQDLIANREREIGILQSRLNVSSAGGSLDPELQRATENVRRIRTRTEQAGRPELVTDRHVGRATERFQRQLDDIMEQIRSGQKTTEEAFERLQEKYGDNIEVLVESLRDRYEDIVNNMDAQHKAEREQLADAYEQQKAVLERMLAEAERASEKLRKEGELHSNVSSIFLENPSIEPRKVVARATDIRAIEDILARHDTVEEMYNKFKIFANLYGREDLGVTATSNDLEAVRVWLDSTKISNVTNRYGDFSSPAPCPAVGGCPSSLVVSYNGPTIGNSLLQTKARLEKQLSGLTSEEANKARVKLSLIFQRSAAENSVTISWGHPGFWGHYTQEECYVKNGVQEGRHFQECGGGWWRDNDGFVGTFHGKAPNGRAEIDAINIWNGQFVARYNNELAATKQAIMQRARLLFDFETNPESNLQKAYREAGITPSLVIPFPLEELDRLISQYNNFVKIAC